MGPDSYRVEVLHYLNPHVLWVEVLNRDSNDKFIFEEIGLYGVLPMLTTIDMEKGAMEMVLSEEWAPAATIVMKNLVLEAAHVWFCPTHTFQSSIFDNDTHKYGELLIQKADGTTIRVLNELIESRFATYDRSLFHQRLESGKIHKQFSVTNALNIYKQLEACSEKLDRPKNLWIKSLKDQTSLLHAAVSLESKMDARKFDISHRGNVNTLLENKLKDLQLCKDYDETSVGRANTRSKDPASKLTSTRLMKKLQIANACKDTSFSDVSSSSSVIMNKYLDDFNDTENTIHTALDTNKKQENNSFNNNDSKLMKARSNGNSITEESFDSINFGKVDNVDLDEVDFRKNRKPYAAKNSNTVARVVYGPPGVDPSKLESKVMPINVPDDDTEYGKSIEDKPIENDKTSSSNELGKTTSYPSLASTSNTTITPSKLTSSLLRRKLEIVDKAKELDTSATGDNLMTNKKHNFDDSDDESISELVEMLNLSTSKDITVTEVTEVTSVDKTKINVNPFKNIDGSQSVFVDKLVSPILMVHTKKDNRIQPTSIMRDIPFGPEIHVALKNMAVNKPMRLQTVSWQTILRGRSLFLISPFGSGKTIGYLPAVCRLVADNKRDSSGFGPSCIIVCATSKSVSDVEMISKMCLHNARIFACYAGIPDINVTTSILNGCDLLICTPCMLVRLLQRDFGVDLRNLSTFVLDDCERLSEVYMKEVKFSLLKINEMLKVRANKEWQVQHIVVSRVWCAFMKRLVLNAPDSVICIGAFHECVLYSQCSTTINFVQSDNKLSTVINFLKDIDKSKKTVIACRTDEEVKVIEKALTKLNYIVFASDSSMTVTDLYDLRVALSDFKEPVLGPILVCCDGNLTHLNVTNAHYLVHYSLPELFSMFCKRFSVLVDNYSNLFKNNDDNIRIKILLEDTNVEQLPKIINFVKRCTTEIPTVLDELCHKVLIEKDFNKARKLVPLCTNLLTMGKCPDFWNCKERHNIFREHDDPKAGLPTNGIVTFQILHYHTAVTFSARLIANIANDGVKKYPQSYSLLSLKLGMYFSKEKNKKLHGTPAVGDICAVALRQNLFTRCQVIKILKYFKGSHIVIIKLIDEEKYETTRDIYLYHLPDDLKAIETHVVQIVLSNLQPVDRDVTFSELATSRLKKITDNDVDLFMRGRISLVIGNSIFVDTLEACQDLSSLSEIVVKSDFRKELLDGHAIENQYHITSLVQLIDMKRLDEKTTLISEYPKSTNLLPKGTWASLDSDDFEPVFLSHVESPATFFLRRSNFSDSMKVLMDNINQYLVDTNEQIDVINVGDIVLAECPDDGMYERARIEEVIKDKARCFFVDQGDWKDIDIKKLRPITEDIITELPFQAIECRLFGVKSASNDWTDFSTHWFVDKCYVFDNDPKYLYAKHFASDKAEYTEGLKYSVVLIDTYSNNDVIINQLMIDLNLANKNDESYLLNNIDFNTPRPVPPNNTGVEKELELNIIDQQEHVLNESDSVDESDGSNEIPLKNIYAQQPIRSVPLVDSDDSDDDRWNVNMTDDFMPLFRAISTKDKAITLDDSKMSSASVTITEVPPKINCSLDSDDLSVCEDSNMKVEKADSEKDVLRKPKLCWRQNKTMVTIKIQLIAVPKYEMLIREKHIKFSTIVDDAKYGFEVELFGGINCGKSFHCNKGQYILVSLSKLMQRKWLTLTKDSGVMKWIVYDMDALDMSSDEESVNDEHLKNIIKTDVKDSDTDDDFMDDVSYRRRDY